MVAGQKVILPMINLSKLNKLIQISTFFYSKFLYLQRSHSLQMQIINLYFIQTIG